MRKHLRGSSTPKLIIGFNSHSVIWIVLEILAFQLSVFSYI